MRNSSLVKRSCADNVTGLKHITEDRDNNLIVMVGERSVRGEGDSEGSLDCAEVRMLA